MGGLFIYRTSCHRNNKIFKCFFLDYQSAKPGDVIVISRGMYKHWAVYIGGDEVVHLDPTGERGTIWTRSLCLCYMPELLLAHRWQR